MPLLPFQPKMVKIVAKAYRDSKARMPNRTPGGRIQDVTNRYVGSKDPAYGAVIARPIAMSVSNADVLA